MASVAQDVRSAVASIVYSADVLELRGSAMERETLQDTVRDICDASRSLQLTVDGLLDYARVGPAIAVPVSISESLTRAHGVLRTFYRDAARRLRLELVPGADWLRGNPVVVEQIFINLLLAYVESAESGPIVCSSASSPADAMVELVIRGEGDDGVRTLALEPGAEFSAAQLALIEARDAAAEQGGQLQWAADAALPRFTLRMPRSEGPR